MWGVGKTNQITAAGKWKLQKGKLGVEVNLNFFVLISHIFFCFWNILVIMYAVNNIKLFVMSVLSPNNFFK